MIKYQYRLCSLDIRMKIQIWALRRCIHWPNRNIRDPFNRDRNILPMASKLGSIPVCWKSLKLTLYRGQMIWSCFLVKIGLQKCLDNLAAYCHMWQLEVNVDKTKVMVMSAGRTAARDITFQGQELQCVNSYKYLGLMISSDGSISKMIEERVTKAKQSSFVLRQALSTSQNVSVNLYCYVPL